MYETRKTRSYSVLTESDMIAAFLHAIWSCLSPVTRFMVSSKGKRDIHRTQSRKNTGGTSRISTTKVDGTWGAEACEKSIQPRGRWVAMLEGSAQARPGLVKRVETGCDMDEIKRVQGMSTPMRSVSSLPGPQSPHVCKLATNQRLLFFPSSPPGPNCFDLAESSV